MTSSFNADSLKWSGELSLRNFFEKYGEYHLPQLARTTCGYSDVDCVNDVASDEIFWVFGITYQQRVLASTVNDRSVSIPLHYQLKFQKMTSKNSPPSPPVSLESLMRDDQFEGQRVQLVAVDATVNDLSSCTTGKYKETLGRLEINGIYKEKYLTARSLLESGELISTVVGIPVYLPITVQVAEGFLCEEDPSAFIEWLRGVEDVSKSFQQQTTNIMCKDILIFDHLPTGDYEYVIPTQYAPLNNYLPTHTSMQSQPSVEDDDSSRDYEEIPADYPLSAPADLSGFERIWSTNQSDSRNDSNVKQVYQQSRSFESSAKSRGPPPPTMPKLPAKKPLINAAGPHKVQPNQTGNVKPKHCPSPNSVNCSKPELSSGRQPLKPTVTSCGQSSVPTQVVLPYNGVRFKKASPPNTALTSSQSAMNASASTAVKKASNACNVVVDCSNWKTAADIPLNVVDFTVEELSRAVELLRMPQLAEAFREQSVDGQLMLEIVTEECLIDEFHCSSFEARKLIQFAKFNWRPKH